LTIIVGVFYFAVETCECVFVLIHIARVCPLTTTAGGFAVQASESDRTPGWQQAGIFRESFQRLRINGRTIYGETHSFR
jgi:hypothetical protein